MTQIIPHNQLLQRALAYINEKIKEQSERPLEEILDQAGMQFNLTPLDMQALQKIFSKD